MVTIGKIANRTLLDPLCGEAAQIVRIFPHNCFVVLSFNLGCAEVPHKFEKEFSSKIVRSNCSAHYSAVRPHYGVVGFFANIVRWMKYSAQPSTVLNFHLFSEFLLPDAC